MIKKIVVGELETNCYLFYNEEKKEGVIIDPGAESNKILNEINKLNLKILYIINTHGHADHISADEELKKFTQAKLLIHKADLSWFNFFSLSTPDAYLEEKQIIKVGGSSLKVFHTPGHSEGSVCLLGVNPALACKGGVNRSGSHLGEGFIFTGDTLFCGGVGRVDLPGGDERKLFRSLKEKILTLPANTIFYPGHGPECTIGEERKHNPFL